MTESRTAVLLVGHGGVPSDFPRAQLQRLKALEGARRGQGQPCVEEAALDEKLRSWPRTDVTDPYRVGLRQLAEALQQRLTEPVVVAYNEFCAPTIEEAVAELEHRGVQQINVLTTMITPGGSHAQIEIPQALERCRARFSHLRLHYAWPFEAELVATLLLEQLASSERYDLSPRS